MNVEKVLRQRGAVWRFRWRDELGRGPWSPPSIALDRWQQDDDSSGLLASRSDNRRPRRSDASELRLTVCVRP